MIVLIVPMIIIVIMQMYLIMIMIMTVMVIMLIFMIFSNHYFQEEEAEEIHKCTVQKQINTTVFFCMPSTSNLLKNKIK